MLLLREMVGNLLDRWGWKACNYGWSAGYADGSGSWNQTVTGLQQDYDYGKTGGQDNAHRKTGWNDCETGNRDYFSSEENDSSGIDYSTTLDK